MPPEIVFCETPEDVADAAAALIFEDQAAAVEDSGIYHIALSGGRTPRLLYEQLASEEWEKTMAWASWEIFWGDERAVPPDNPESNFHLAQTTLLNRVEVGGVFRMQAELPNLQEAAEDYARTLRARFGFGIPAFETLLLGMGPDGHTASLFPGHPALQSKALVEVVEVKAPVPKRLTLTLPVLNRARHAIFLVTGEDKAEKVREILGGKDATYPAALVRPEEGQCTWLLDEAASYLIRS
ncbi:MAG TPA: 6-phosphogluconolactonase [bacterium]|jgi:6-phosphogluconolactonase